MSSLFDRLDDLDVSRVIALRHPPSGLKAFLVLDDLSLGPAAGGVRTLAYASESEALADAATLARQMTLKCSLAGLDAGGGKLVVLDHAGLDRDAAFRWLGRRVAELRCFYTAGDLGTRAEDLAQMASGCSFVETSDLGPAVGRGALRCLEALAERFGRQVSELTVGIQGAGFIGRSVARAYGQAGARIVVADLVPERAAALAEELGGRALSSAELPGAEIDVLAPCGMGGTLTTGLADRLKAWGVCGAANAQLGDEAAAEALRARRIEHVPGVLVGAGAVIQGIGRARMGLSDPGVLIDELRATTARLLEDADRSARSPSELAVEWAWERIELGRS